MSVIAFKRNTAKRIEETKRLTRQAIQKHRRKPLLFHNGSQERPVRLFRARPVSPNAMTQADIDAVPASHIPLSANQLYAKVLRGELKITRFFRKKVVIK